jgi:glycosyltransferase involved in cell wall biosynthesis
MKIALCICTYQRPQLLERLLNSLHDIQLGELAPDAVRIMVIDNYPDGRARAICERLARTLPGGLDFFEESRKGVAYARNTVIDVALKQGADFVAFLDDDDLPHPDWLLRLFEKQKETQADIVGSVFPPVVNPEWPAWLAQSPLFDQPKQGSQTSKYGVAKNIGIGSTLISCKLLARMQDIGPLFSDEFGSIGCEDADFFARATKNGAVICQTSKAIVRRDYEQERLTVVGLLRDAYRIGNCINRLLTAYGTRAQVRRRKRKACKKVIYGLAGTVLQFFSKTRAVRSMYQVCRELGVLFGYGGSK